MNRNGWTKTYVDLLDNPELSSEDKLVEIYLRWHARPDRLECWPSQASIAEWAGLSDDGSVRRSIRELKAAGRLAEIEPQRPGRRTCTYHLAPRGGRWVAIQNRVLADEELWPRDKIIFAYLLKHVGKSRRYAIVRQTDLAKETGFTRRQVQESVYRLEKREALSRERQDRRKPTTYRFPPYDPPQLTGYDKASTEQQEPGHQDTSLQERALLPSEGLRSGDGENHGGDRGNGRGSPGRLAVHQDDAVGNVETPSSEALDSGSPLIPPKEGTGLDAHRTEKDLQPETTPSTCNRGHQLKTIQGSVEVTTEEHSSGRRMASSVRGGGSSSKALGVDAVESSVVDINGRALRKDATQDARSSLELKEDGEDSPWYGLNVRWSRRWGWIELRDPFTGEWHEVRKEDCPEWVIRAANEQRQSRREKRLAAAQTWAKEGAR